MKKITSLSAAALVLAMAVSVFGGCSSDNEEKKSKRAQKDDESEVTEVEEEETEDESSACLPADIKAGDIVSFGKYQDEAIEWQVLEKMNDSVLLISDKCIEVRPFHNIDEDTTWEKCELRSWLNGEFYDQTFSDDEKEAMVVNKVFNEDATTEFVNGGSDTEDMIYILSKDEASKFFADDSARITKPTQHAIDSNIAVDDKGNSPWNLRTPGDNNNKVAVIYSTGTIFEEGNPVWYNDLGVRPVISVKLEK